MIGVWTGCGFSTIAVIFPPRDILGYDACVTLTSQSPPAIVDVAIEEALEDEENIPFVII